MKISELIEKLQELKKEHGDLEAKTDVHLCCCKREIDYIEISDFETKHIVIG